jgi:hypothetical protein
MPDSHRSQPAITFRAEIDRMTVDEAVLARHLLRETVATPAQLSRFLRQLADWVDALPWATFLMECAFARGLLAHFLAAVADFRDDPRRAVTRGVNRRMLALDEADLNKRAQTGTGLRTWADYDRFRPSWGEARTTIERHLGSLGDALAYCGLNAHGQPEAHLIRQQGCAGGANRLTLEERVEYLARGIERNYGRRVTYEGWDDIREVLGRGVHPSAHQLVGRKRTGAEYNWKTLHDLAYTYALARPESFPYTAAYKTDVDRLRAKAA